MTQIHVYIYSYFNQFNDLMAITTKMKCFDSAKCCIVQYIVLNKTEITNPNRIKLKRLKKNELKLFLIISVVK